MSKFHPIEFWESVKYYQGTSSPIPACKKENGYSKAWQHHKGHNPHHYEYWTDNYDSGTTLIPMPFDRVVEMIADWCAAGRTYQGKDWSLKSQSEWWEHKKKLNPAIHIKTRDLLDIFFCGWINDSNPSDKVRFKRWKMATQENLFEYYSVNIKNFK
jgi:hypothetical protein